MIERKRIAGAPIFDRLVLVDETGETLVDTNLDAITIGAGRQPACNRPQDEGGATLTQDDGRSLVVSMPYRFKDDYAGKIVGWIKPAVIYDHLLGIDGDAQAIAYMLAEPAADDGLRLVGGATLNAWAKLLARRRGAGSVGVLRDRARIWSQP